MLTHSIDFTDPSELTIAEKIFYGAKRACVVFAVAAVMISGLDLMNIRPREAVAGFAQAQHDWHVAEWPALIRSGINQIALKTPSVAATADNSDDTFAETDNALLADLAAVRHEDAVQVAMASSPPLFEKATVADLAQRAQDMVHQARDMALPEAMADTAPPTAAKPVAGVMQLASVNPGDLAALAPQPAVIQISLPERTAVLPLPAPGVPPLSPAQRLHLEGKTRARAEACLAKAVYFEARDQPYRGQVVVAQVVMNRVFSGVYPHDVCGVIYQNASHYLACQFTFACNGKRKVIDERGAWARAKRIAEETLDGELYVKAVGTATHYHATYVHPC